MADIKVIWGPNSRRIHGDRIVWVFSGVRANGEIARWHLSLWFDSRRFTTKPLLRNGADGGLNLKLEQIPNIADAPVMKGRMTDMLRAKLKPEHIVEATRLALDWQRKRL